MRESWPHASCRGGRTVIPTRPAAALACIVHEAKCRFRNRIAVSFEFGRKCMLTSNMARQTSNSPVDEFAVANIS